MSTTSPTTNGIDTSTSNGGTHNTTKEPMLVTDLQTWKEKLITHEDYLHHHKIIGILVLLMFMIRFSLIGPTHDMGFKTYPQFTIPSILLHFLLNVSSFQFKIPQKRIRDGGRIWPEYRLHAAVFAIRSMITILLYHYEQTYHIPPNYNYNYIILMGGMLAADFVSYSVSTKYQSRSVRDLDTHPTVKFFFSFMQFQANAGMLLGLRRYTLPFAIIFVTQTTPFVATLRRKQVFNSNVGGAMMYGLFLIYPAIFVQLDYINEGHNTFYIIRTIANVAALQRMTPHIPKPISTIVQNKYVVWTTAFILLRYLRQNVDTIPETQFKSVWLTSFILCILLGFYKSMSELRQRNNNLMDMKKVKST